MSSAGTFVRRNFEPLVLSVQVLVDLAVIWLACWLGWKLREVLAGAPGPEFGHYREVFLLTSAVSLVCFHAYGMYSPLKSLLNIEEFKAIAKSTVASFLVVHALLLLLRTATGLPEHGIYRLLIPLHNFVNIEITDERGVWQFSRMGVVLAFAMIGILTTASRFSSFKVIQWLHRRGIGNRNVLIYGTGDTAKRLQKKFVLVPTLGLNLLGFVSERREEVGARIDRFEVLGVAEELEFLIRKHKISEVFVAVPEADERGLMDLIETLERNGVIYHVVPRFYHIFSHKVRIETLDSIPLVTRPDRNPTFLQLAAKRALDLAVVFRAPLDPPALRAHGDPDRATVSRARVLPPEARRQGRCTVRDAQVPHDVRGAKRRRTQAQEPPRPAPHGDRPLAAPLQPRRAAAVDQRAAR